MLRFYKQIWHYTGPSQVSLILLSLLVAALAAVPLQFQKDIINSLKPDLIIEDIFILCLGYLAIIITSNVLKFLLNYKSSVLGERTVKVIRQRVYSAQHSKLEQVRDPGTLTTIIAAEAEEVGRFVGAAIANPLLQVGTLVAIISYVALTQPYLGFFLVLIVAPQAAIVLILQKKVNSSVRKRTLVLRGATSAISSETLKNVQDVQADILADFDHIYTVRRKIFRLKLSMKFGMNLLNGIGLVGILMIGGVLMMNKGTDIGTVIASLAALDRINDPWRQLLNFYKELSSVRVKFDLIVGGASLS